MILGIIEHGILTRDYHVFILIIRTFNLIIFISRFYYTTTPNNFNFEKRYKHSILTA